MASSNSSRKPVPGFLEPHMRRTSTPMCSSFNDSGYHSISKSVPFTPFKSLNHGLTHTTPLVSPLPPTSFSETGSCNSVAQVLFSEDDFSNPNVPKDVRFDSLGLSFEDCSSDISVDNSTLSGGIFKSHSTTQGPQPRRTKSYISVFSPGYEIGETHLDFFRELGHYRNLVDVVYRICDFLSPEDLKNASRVSHTWHTLVDSHSSYCYKQRRTTGSRTALFEQFFGKENHRQSGKVQLSKEPRQVLGPFRSIGNLVESPQKPVTKEAPLTTSKLPLYQEQAKKLLPCEHLQPCPRCQSPSRVTPGEKRAHCTRTQCSFDYCTQCRDTFHAPTPCKKAAFAGTWLRSPKKNDLIGHKGAKRNLKRL